MKSIPSGKDPTEGLASNEEPQMNCSHRFSFLQSQLVTLFLLFYIITCCICISYIVYRKIEKVYQLKRKRQALSVASFILFRTTEDHIKSCVSSQTKYKANVVIDSNHLSPRVEQTVSTSHWSSTEERRMIPILLLHSGNKSSVEPTKKISFISLKQT